MLDDNSFFSRVAVSQEIIDKTNLLSRLHSKRALYLEKYKADYLEHLKNEYNILKKTFPEVNIEPEARIKGLKSYNEKVNRVISSDSHKDIYDIFANRYIISSVNGSSKDSDIIPILYKMWNFLSYDFEGIYIMPERLKDYVASPKHSTYQSLHLTKVHLNSGNYVSETQLRSYIMHSNACAGIASHNNYKERIPGITPVPNLLEYVLDDDGFCIEVREMSYEKAFKSFFGIPYDPQKYLLKEKY